jgi:F-type H+-transporting ATPase subunit epsilon
MAEKSFKLRVYTPQGLVLDSEATSASIPGIDGEIGILPDHTQYTGVLGAGLLQYESEKVKPARLIIAGGFASFQANELVVLADGVDFESNLSAIKVDNELKELEKRLLDISSFDPEWAVVQQKIRRLETIRTVQ